MVSRRKFWEQRHAVGCVLLASLSCACKSQPAEVREEPAPERVSTRALAPSPAPAAQPRPDAGARRDEKPPLTAPAAAIQLPPGVKRMPGTKSATCVEGWITPERGSALRSTALDMLRSHPDERFVVVEMRYFIGPEDAEVLQPRGRVERWYIKAYSELEPRRRQRWLVRRAAVGSGIDAVAPYESSGYGPGVWRRPDARDESLADPFQRPCQHTKAGEKCMGLPREVLGCLAGT